MFTVSKPLFDAERSQLTKKNNDVLSARIMVMGDKQCGKTSMIFRWLNGAFVPIAPGSYMEDIYRKRYKHGLMEGCKLGSLGERYSSEDDDVSVGSLRRRFAITDVQFLDCEASDTTYYSELRSLQMKQADAFILCFDMTNKQSFEAMKRYCKRVEDTLDGDEDPIIIICATKSDLIAEYEVSFDDVSEMLEKDGLSSANFFETSSKFGSNTTELLCSTLKQIKQKKKMALSRESTTTNESCKVSPTVSSEREIGQKKEDRQQQQRQQQESTVVTPVSSEKPGPEPEHSFTKGFKPFGTVKRHCAALRSIASLASIGSRRGRC